MSIFKKIIMKQILLLAICSFFFFSINAQVTVSVNPDEISESVDLDNYDIETEDPTDIVGHGLVVNDISGTKNFVWVRNEVYLPTGWKTAVCDLNSCWFHTISTKEFELEGGFEGTLDVHAYPGGSGGATLDELTTGEAIVEISVTEVGNEENTFTATYTLSLLGTVSVEITDKPTINVYPNPTTDFFKLTGTDAVDNIVVHNVVGSKVKNFEVAEGASYDVADLPTGMYLVALMNEDTIVRTIRLSKK